MNSHVNKEDSTADEIDELDVELLQDRLKTRADDLELKKDLAYALLDRYLFGTENGDSGDDADLELIGRLLDELPCDMGFLPRAYVAHINANATEAADFFIKHVTYFTEAGEELSCDMLYDDLLHPFWDASPEFWTSVADAIQKISPDSAAAYTVKAELTLAENVDAAMSLFLKALERDPTYWWASWSIASEYADEKNWKSAEVFYEKAFETGSGSWFPELCFDYAWCMGKLKRFDEEQRLLQQCLELDEHFPYALNNLGWSLYKQRRYLEALKIFEESVEKGNDGAYPLRNRARTLEKLGRLIDAIDAWRRAGKGRPLGTTIKREIERLERLAELREAREGHQHFDEESDAKN